MTDTNWKAVFRRYSWWYAPQSKRTFSLTQCWHDDDGSLMSVELLEYKTEWEVNVSIQDMIKFLHDGTMVCVSTMPVERGPDTAALERKTSS